MMLASLEKAATNSNFDYLLLGYNVFKGNPDNGGLDPGFQNAVFKASYSKGELTADERFKVPDFYDILRMNACSLDFRS
jgi:hypothetical protein